MNIFDLLESPGMGRPRDTKGIQSAADQSAASVIGSGTTKHEDKKKPVTMMGKNVKEAVEEAVVKPDFKMPPESLQDKMYRQHQELRKKRGAPSPEEYKQRIAQKQAEIDALKEGILDRAAPKMPKPRNPANAVLGNKVNAAGKHLDKKRRQELNPKHKHQDPLEEGWKDAVAGAALAGSIALGGVAHAGEPVVGMGQSQNMQMAVDMAKHNARVKYLKTVHGDNFQDKQMPEHRYGKLELKPNDKGGYIATVPLIVDAETQNESLRPGERHHFETDPVTGKRVYKGIRGDQQDAPQRAKDDPAARADQERKAHIAHDRGLTEGSTDDPRFQKMMGNIQKSTPIPMLGYVALEFASEQKSKKIKGVTRNGKPIPDVINNPEEELDGKIEFTPDRIEQQLMSIGRKYGWDSIDPGQGRGYTELFFETTKEYTSDNQNILAANIVNTVNAINKFFNGMNSSLQATGLPGYTVSLWQGMGTHDDINQITDLSQMTKIAKSTGAKVKNTRTSDDVGVELGNAILAHYKEFGDDGGYSKASLNLAAKIGKIYITQGERAGLEAQMKAGSVSEMIDELISDAGLSGIRTIWELDETQGVAEEFRLGKKLGTKRDRFKSLRKRKDGILGEVDVSESQAVKITDYDTWSDKVKKLGGEIHPQKDRNLLVAQSWDGEQIGKFHLGKSMGFINQSGDLDETIRKMGSQYRLLSKKGKNLGTFDSKAGAEKHEREVQYFKHKNMEEDASAIKKKISKYEELALAANRAGDDAKCKMYQKKIQALKSQGVDEGWKSKLAGAALAGAAALGGGDVDAQNIDLPGPQAVMIAHIVADVNGREVNKTVNLGTQYDSKEQAEQDLEEYMQSKGITRYSIRVEQSYDQPGGYGQRRRTSGYATGGYSATGPISAPGLGDMIAGKVSREIRASIPDRGGYATGGTNQGQRPRDGSQWWRDQLPRIKEDVLEEDIESHLYLMSRAGYDIVQEEWSDKYKSSINCSNPKGFSQKAHCAGKKKNEDVSEARNGDTNFGSTVTHGSWVVYNGSKVKRFKSREGAKAYAEKNGGKVASSEHYADKIQKQGVAEGKPENTSRRGFLKALAVAAVLSSTPVAKLMSDASSKMSIVKHRGKLGKYQGSDIDCTGYKIGKKQFYITVDGEPYTVQTGTGAGFMGQDFKNLDFKSDTYLQKIAPWLNTKDEYILQIADYDIELYDQNNQKIFPAKDQQQTKEMYSNGFIDAIIGYLDVYQTSAIQRMAEVPSEPHYPEELPAIDKGSKGVSAIASKAAGNDPLHIARLASLAKRGYDAITKKPDAQQSAPSFNAPAALPAPSDDNVLRPELNKQKEKSPVKRRGVDEDIERYVEALSRAGYEVTEEKVRLDPKCWSGKKIGNPKTKMKGGVRVNNCVPK